MLYARPGAPEASLATAYAWLWRIPGPVTEPEPGAVGFGGPADARELEDAVDSKRLRGAVIFATGTAAADGPVPERREVPGGPRFEGGGSARGDFTLFDGGDPVVRSNLGSHAVRSGNVLVLGAGIESWGDVAGFWVHGVLAGFLTEVLDRPLALLPPVGCLRLDDAPVTAEAQLVGRAKSDRDERQRIDGMLRVLERTHSKLVVAVVARALDPDGSYVPVEQVYPESIEALARGVRDGMLEPACHGLTHIDDSSVVAGKLDAREFLSIDRAEAGRRLDEASEWLSRQLGRPCSFIAPAWGYGAGALDAAVERELPTWMPPKPGPLLEGLLFHETLDNGLPSLERLDYSPLAAFARAGIPPTVVFHGRLLDGRPERLRVERDFFTLARLLRWRDLDRIARLDQVRWVGAAELVDRLRAHAEVEAAEEGPCVPDGQDAPVLLYPDGSRR